MIILYRDVAAGVAILLEAGGLVTTANPPENIETAEIQDVRLGSRLYLAIRLVYTYKLAFGSTS
jgi:fructose-1,6-bisphosphatase/inositol monophosphatase family enzyme